MDFDQLEELRDIIGVQRVAAKMERSLRSALEPVDLASVTAQRRLQDARLAGGFADAARQAAGSVAGLESHGVAKAIRDFEEMQRSRTRS